ncbi:MAG: (2Fe-2S)-binding protein [Thermoanaerobaculia bacterium]|nr:(2Fe-2S)-binding protein [Thermoanaerobaculia bacterium]
MSRDDRDPPRGWTRRDFLRSGAVAGVAGSFLAHPLAGNQQESKPKRVAGVEVLGPGPVPVALRVNGETYRLRLEPRVTLLDALRDRIGLTGSKKVCDQGTCGACTVLLDGEPAYACSVLALEVGDATIETVEAIGDPESLHPLQTAFVEADAQQCGFCTPGFVVATKALLDRDPKPSPERISEALAGNFCRCGTYGGIRTALTGPAGPGKETDHG